MSISKQRSGFLMVLPIMVYMLFFSIFPLLYSLAISFTYYNPLGLKGIRFIGLDNFKHILFSGKTYFWPSLKLTVLFTLLTVTLEFLIGLGLALLLSRNIRAKNLFRSVLLLPLSISPAIIALIFRYMLNQDIGVINYFVQIIGFKEGIPWTISKKMALLSVAIVDIWQYTPFCFLILLAGMMALPKEPYESAIVEGASNWTIFWRITLSLLKMPIAVILLFRIIDSFNMFDKIFVLTRGGPAQSTEVLSMFAYKTGLTIFHVGEGAAVSWIMTITIFIICFILLKYIAQSGKGAQ